MMSYPVPELERHDILCSKSNRYMVLNLHGSGAYGRVAKCVNLATNSLAAVKVHDCSENFDNEVKMLKALRGLDPEKKNIVRFIEDFTFNSFCCLAFEMLDKSLWELMAERKSQPLRLNEIRPVIHQLLVAFDALKSVGIVHADLKPDNIMLVSHKHMPFKVKLIDFGLALPVSELTDGMDIQVDSHQAPEVTLGLPLTEAVDMWGVGCVAAFLYFGTNLFRGNSAYHRMKAIVHMLGQPEDQLLSAGLETWKYFSRVKGSRGPAWRLKSPEEYQQATGLTPHVNWQYFKIAKNLDDAVQSFPEKMDTLEYGDRMEFLNLLKSCLHVNADERITPRDALKHSFVTMVHLAGDELDGSSYVDDALQLMVVSPLQSLDGSDLSDTETEPNSDDNVSDSSDGISDNEESHPGALKADLKRESPSAIVCSRDSYTSCRSSGEDADTENFSDEDDFMSDTSASSDTDSYISTFSEGEIPFLADSELSTASSSEEDSDAELYSCHSATAPSAATDLQDGDKVHAPPNKEESFAATNDGCTYCYYVPVVCITNDDKVSTDEDVTFTSSYEAAEAGDVLVDVDNVKKKKKKNVFKRAGKFFRRVTERVVNIFRRRRNSSSMNPCGFTIQT